MKQVVALTIIAGCLAGSAAGGSIHEALEAVLADTPANQHVATLVFLRDQLDLEPLEAEFERTSATRRERHEMVVLALQATALGTQSELLAYLAQRKKAGAVRDFSPFWIANAIAVEALPAEIDTIAARDDVGTVYFDFGIELVEPVEEQSFDQIDGQGSIAGITSGVEAVRAPEVWALGIDGTGVLVATLDTGVDGSHVALRDRWRGVADARYADNPEWAWFDPIGFTTFPFDAGLHGTHTMGSVCGGLPGEQIGVAPGAQWISAGVIDRGGLDATVRNAMLAFEWMVDPDGDPTTNWDVPDVCSNSWRLRSSHGRPPCDPEFWAFLDAVEAVGCVILFSAGNEGPGSQTIGRPPDRATDDYRTFAVGAIDANDPNWPIARFSSRGPSFCGPDGAEAIKPEISAPGVNVRSSVPGNGYRLLSGTSMASPHVNGVVALMRQANPEIPVDVAKQIIFDTAVDLGSTGDDNIYGWGMIDAFEAVRSISGFEIGDLNCDGKINTFDIEPYLLALFDRREYANQYPDCDIELADINEDGSINAFDIEPFVELLFGP